MYDGEKKLINKSTQPQISSSLPKKRQATKGTHDIKYSEILFFFFQWKKFVDAEISSSPSYTPILWPLG